jgi:hypothetical protein
MPATYGQESGTRAGEGEAGEGATREKKEPPLGSAGGGVSQPSGDSSILLNEYAAVLVEMKGTRVRRHRTS